MKKMYLNVLSLFCMALMPLMGMAQTTIFNVTTYAAMPSGWTGTNNVNTNPIPMPATAPQSYFLLEANTTGGTTTRDEIITKTYDLTGATSATFTVDVATYGAGNNNPAAVEFSSDGGATWKAAINTAVPTSTTYVTTTSINPASGFVFNNQFKMRITNAGTANRGVRLQNLKLVAQIPAGPCTTPSSATSNTATATAWNTANGSFTAPTPAPTGYLVVYSTSATAPTVSNGTTYTAAAPPTGTTFVQDAATTSYSLSGLSGATTYYTYVYAYNNTNCTGGPVYSSVASSSFTTPVEPPQGFQLSTTNTLYTIDFDQTAPNSNVGQFAGTTINQSQASGTLNSNTWSVVSGAGNPTFGGSITTGSGVKTPGAQTAGNFFAMQVAPGNNALAVQPTSTYMTPGSVNLKIQNVTGVTMDKLTVAFTSYFFNGDNATGVPSTRSQNVWVEYSTDGTTWTSNIPTNPALPTTALEDEALHANYFVNDITGLSVAPNNFIYIRWRTADNGTTGSGVRDELAIDDINLIANATTTTAHMTPHNYELAFFNGNTTLTGPASVSTSATFANGVVNTDATNLLTINQNPILPSVAIVNGAGYVDGPVVVNTTATNQLVVPVGDGGVVSPVTVTPSTTPTSVLYEYHLASTPSSTSFTAPLKAVDKNEYWTIQSLSGSPSVALSVNYGPQTALQNGNVSALTLANLQGANWTNVGGSATGDQTSGTLSATGVLLSTTNGFFTIGSTDATVLPLQLVSFTGKLNGNNAVLNWRTYNEINVAYYELQRSDNGANFRKLSTLNATNPSSPTVLAYTYNDANLAANSKFAYRLKMVDQDGSFKYSNVVTLTTGANANAPYIVMNPVKDELQVANVKAGTQLKVVSMDGKVLVNTKVSSTLSKTNVSQLAPGNYIVNVLEANGTSTSLKMIKL